LKLDFVVAGISKCGTTSFCSALALHPDIFFPDVKEPNIFSDPLLDEKWESFEAMFAGGAGKAVWGEGTTFYSTIMAEVASRERMLAHFPDIRLIFVVRDPLTRIESSFREFHNSGPLYGMNTPFSLIEAFETIPQLIEDTRYGARIDNYRRYMRPDQIHIVFFEDFVRAPHETLASCFAFLGLPDLDHAVPIPRLNEGETKLYDTRFLRALRTNRILDPWIGAIPDELLNRVGRRVGLRREFAGRKLFAEQPEARAYVMKLLGDESRAFLVENGKPADFWWPADS
jgi:Sulfotransferase family